MNERIKELAQEVFSFKYKTDPNELNPGHHMDHLHKFAELIVRECIKVCNSRVGNSDYNTGRMHCASDIKEHFGVE